MPRTNVLSRTNVLPRTNVSLNLASDGVESVPRKRSCPTSSHSCFSISPYLLKADMRSSDAPRSRGSSSSITVCVFVCVFVDI